MEEKRKEIAIECHDVTTPEDVEEGRTRYVCVIGEGTVEIVFEKVEPEQQERVLKALKKVII